MMLESKPCVCPKCGTEQTYQVVISYCSFMSNMLPRNKCYSCGHQLTEADIDSSKCGEPVYRTAGRNLDIIINNAK